MSAKGHVWTAPGWQELFSRCSFGSRVDGALARTFFTLAALVGAAMCSACSCGTRKAAGHNALRGSGPGQIQDTAIAMSAVPPIATSIAHFGMSALGQKQTFRSAIAMSALPPKADICSAPAYVRFGPIADSCTAAINAWLRTGIDVG